MGRKSKSHIRKPEILDHLYKVMEEEGLEGASFARVADHMGVYPSMLVHYFKTKEQMMVEFVDYLLERFKSWYRADMDDILDPIKRFDLLLDRIFMVKGQGLIDPGVFYAVIYLSFRNERIKKRVRAMYALLMESLVNEINTAIGKGALKRIDTELFSHVIAVVTEGLDYCRFMLDDPKAVESTGLYLKNVIRRLLGEGVEDEVLAGGPEA